MNGYLRQSTASQTRLIGPFLDDVDFKTAETGLTIANTDIKLRANGTTLANKNSGGGTHQVNGEYSVTWDATDTANVGELKYSVVVAGALPVFGTYVVLEEAVYDALYADSAPGFATVASISALNNLSAAQVNAEVVDALNVDTYAEPGQGAPAATTTITGKLGWVYKFMRNKLDQTATTFQLYNDDGTTVGSKATVSSDGTTTTRGEIVSGP